MTIPEFVSKVTNSPDEIRQGKGGSLLLVKQIEGKEALNKLVFVRLKPSENGDFYRVETAFVKPYGKISKDYPLLWSASVPHSTDSSNPSTSATASPVETGSDRSTGTPAQSNLSKTIPQSQQNTRGQTTHTPATLRTALAKIFNQGWLGRLLSTGKFQIITRAQAKAMGANPNAQAFFNPKNDTTYFVADNIDQKTDLRKLMLHEIGVHALQLGRNNAQFKAIQTQLENLMKQRKLSPALKAAIQAALDAKTSPELMTEEILGYLVEFHPDLNISQKVIAFFRSMLRNLRLLNSLTEQDVVFMASRALRAAPESLLFDGDVTGKTRESNPPNPPFENIGIYTK